MAKSRAKKIRHKRIREGGMNPELMRGDWGGINPMEKRTPTRTERLERKWKKHKKRWDPFGEKGPTFLISEKRLSFSSLPSRV